MSLTRENIYCQSNRVESNNDDEFISHDLTPKKRNGDNDEIEIASSDISSMSLCIKHSLSLHNQSIRESIFYSLNPSKRSTQKFISTNFTNETFAIFANFMFFTKMFSFFRLTNCISCCLLFHLLRCCSFAIVDWNWKLLFEFWHFPLEVKLKI